MTTEVETLRKKIDAGELAHVSRATWHEGIEALAKNIRNDNETEAQSYTRAITETEIGKLLFGAYKNAPFINGGPASGFASTSTPPGAGQDYVPRHIGVGHAELHSRAVDAVRAKPGLSYARAVANIYEKDPELRSKVRDEHMAHAMAMSGEPAPPLAHAQQGGTDAGSSSEIWPADTYPPWKS